MFSSCRLQLCLTRIAAASAAEYAQLVNTGEGPHPSQSRSAASESLWFDDTEQARRAHEDHIESAEYKELHRPAVTNSAMGLFGGEPGFEKSYRVWVDPDRPQMKHVFNQSALAKNIRYARYGYFKRDMHLLDVDKLVRHARLLPTPNRLLGDFLYQRVPLPDKSSAAFIRYQRDQLVMLDDWHRGPSLACAEEMFERMVVTNIPPVEVGVETHAEMILCCATCREWEKGWDVYVQRAREMEEEHPEDFVLDTRFYDAVLELCVACKRPVEGLAIMKEAIERHLRPRSSMLEKMMILCSIAVEKSTDESSLANSGSSTSGSGDDEVDFVQCGLDAWALLDFYKIDRTAASIEAYMRMCSMFNKPQLVLEAASLADALQLKLPLSCYYWCFYAIRGVPDFGDFIVDTMSKLPLRGLTPDFVLFTIAFMHCAVQRDGELALTLHNQFLVHYDLNPTPEMTLLFVQACANCDTPRVEMLSTCESLIDRLEAVGSAVDNISEIYDQYMELAAHLGAVSSAFSKVKKLVSFGKALTTRQMNSLLLANSNASPPNGGLSMSTEIMSLFRLLRIPANDDTMKCLMLCQESHGSNEEVDAWMASLEEQRAEAPGGTLGEDGDIPIMQEPPHKLRRLMTEWVIRPRDTALKRFGQNSRLRGSSDVGSMVGSVIPFGRSPGEKTV